MLKRARRSTLLTAVIVALGLTSPPATQARGDFILWGHEEFTVAWVHSNGWLYDWSRATVISDGSVHDLHAYDSSAVNLLGGGSVHDLDAYDSSAVNLLGASVQLLYAYDSSVVDISGGSVSYLDAYVFSAVDISGGRVGRFNAFGSSSVDLSGGSVDSLNAHDTSAVTFHARDFHLGGNLSLDGDRVLGTGDLSGEWFDGTRWAVDITGNASRATILAIPEPATLSLLLLGGLAILRRRR